MAGRSPVVWHRIMTASALLTGARLGHVILVKRDCNVDHKMLALVPVPRGARQEGMRSRCHARGKAAVPVVPRGISSTRGSVGVAGGRAPQSAGRGHHAG